VATFACVNPVETTADKLSALAWRVCAPQRAEETDDPTIRHLHDLAARETHATASSEFSRLVRQAAVADTRRRGVRAPRLVARIGETERRGHPSQCVRFHACCWKRIPNPRRGNEDWRDADRMEAEVLDSLVPGNGRTGARYSAATA
jgi:hypothetical protein